MASQPPAGGYLQANAAPPKQRPKWGRIFALLLGMVVVVWGGIEAWQFVRVTRSVGRLSNASPDVRSQAAADLGAMKSRRAVPALIAALRDGDATVRTAVAQALGQIGDPRALEPLLTALKSNVDPNTSDDDHRAIGEALGGLGKPALDPLMNLLNDKDLGGYARAGLVRMGGPAADSIAALLTSPDQDLAIEAAGMLGDMKDKRGVGPLMAALRTGNSDLRYSVVYALGELKDAQAVGPVEAVLRGDASAENRRGAAEALGVIGDAGAVDALIAATSDSDMKVRQSAARALGNINDPRAANFLLDAFAKHNWDLIAGASGFFIRRGQPGTEDTLIEALNQTGDEGMADVLLNSGNDKLHHAAMDWAGKNDYEINYEGGGKPTTWGNTE